MLGMDFNNCNIKLLTDCTEDVIIQDFKGLGTLTITGHDGSSNTLKEIGYIRVQKCTSRIVVQYLTPLSTYSNYSAYGMLYLEDSMRVDVGHCDLSSSFVQVNSTGVNASNSNVNVYSCTIGNREYALYSNRLAKILVYSCDSPVTPNNNYKYFAESGGTIFIGDSVTIGGTSDTKIDNAGVIITNLGIVQP